MHLIGKSRWPCRPHVRGADKGVDRSVPRLLFQPSGTRGLGSSFPEDKAQ
jgi:hypothetical protein